MTFKLNRIQAAEFPPRLQKLFNKAFGQIEDQINSILVAQTAAAAANAAAAAANAAAATAQTTANDITSASSLGSSYVSGVTITATDAGSNVTITISAHTRRYPQPDGSTVNVSVSGGSVTLQPYSTLIYIYYDDPSRAGGAVTYQATTSDATAAQLGARHTVGSVMTPAALASPTGGSYVRAPGVGQIP